jgi:hypothetical protein
VSMRSVGKNDRVLGSDSRTVGRGWRAETWADTGRRGTMSAEQGQSRGHYSPPTTGHDAIIYRTTGSDDRPKRSVSQA